MEYRLWVSKIAYGSATVEADSEEEAKEKFYDSDIEIAYHDSEISDVTAEALDEFKQRDKKRRVVDLDRVKDMLNYVYKDEMNDLCISPTGMLNMLRNLAGR